MKSSSFSFSPQYTVCPGSRNGAAQAVPHLRFSRFSVATQACLQERQPKPVTLTDVSDCEKVPLVKICGVTNVKDAIMAAEAGANYVGMILWPKSKRSIGMDTAREIALAVKRKNAQPVGVFVGEDADTINSCCKFADIDIAQLHGDGARSSCPRISSSLKTIYVLHVDKNGVVQTTFPTGDNIDWILLDSLQGGSGHSFDWENLKSLSLTSSYRWFLAGGLNPENVSRAISILKPDVVDVSSGITGTDGLLKDQKRVVAFMNAVRNWPVLA